MKLLPEYLPVVQGNDVLPILSQKHLINIEIPYQTSSAGKGRLTLIDNAEGIDG